MEKTIISIELTDELAERLEQVDLGEEMNKKVKAYLLRKLKTSLQTNIEQIDSEIEELES